MRSKSLCNKKSIRDHGKTIEAVYALNPDISGFGPCLPTTPSLAGGPGACRGLRGSRQWPPRVRRQLRLRRPPRVRRQLRLRRPPRVRRQLRLRRPRRVGGDCGSGGDCGCRPPPPVKPQRESVPALIWMSLKETESRPKQSRIQTSRKDRRCAGKWVSVFLTNAGRGVRT
jgi:hypothetical protein